MAGLGLKHMLKHMIHVTLANRDNDGFSLLHCVGKHVLKHYGTYVSTREVPRSSKHQCIHGSGIRYCTLLLPQLIFLLKSLYNVRNFLFERYRDGREEWVS